MSRLLKTMDNIKPGDRVTFLVVDRQNKTCQAAGVVTRLSPTGHPMIQPDYPILPGSRMANIQKAEIKRGL